MREELFKGLTEEQITKAKARKNQEEMLALAKEEGIELTEEQLEAVGGGARATAPVLCPDCDKNNFRCVVSRDSPWCTCLSCGHRWTINKALKI